MKQLENSIIKWHRDVFPNATKQAVVDKLLEEIEELKDELLKDDPLYKYELADVMIAGIALLAKDDEFASDYIKKKLGIIKKRDYFDEKPDGSKIRFKKPTEDEVRAYATEKGYNLDAEKFIAHYETVGWMVGRNKMKCWKSACKTWHLRNKQNTPQIKSADVNPY